MKKIRLGDIAREAGVGVATVDRVMNRRAPVRPETEQRIVQAALRLGYRFPAEFLPAADAPLRHPASGRLRVGAILLPHDHSFYGALIRTLQQQLAPHCQPGSAIECVFHPIDAVEDVAASIEALSHQVNRLILVALDNARIRHAVQNAAARGVKVFALLSDLSPCGHAGFIGLDNRKAGRTAAWMVQRLGGTPGKVGIILGDNRFLCQETCEISFRSYLREHATGHRVLEPVNSGENVGQGYRAAAQLIAEHPDLSAIYAPCGGVEGIIDALRDSGKQTQIALICHGPVPDAELALIDGTLDVMLLHRIRELASRVVCALLQAESDDDNHFIAAHSSFELITKENIPPADGEIWDLS